MIDNTTLIELLKNDPSLDQAALTKAANESIRQLMDQHNIAYKYYQSCPWTTKQLGKREATLYGTEVTADDYVIFIKPNGYAVMLRKAYEKLSARDKKKLMIGCTFVSL